MDEYRPQFDERKFRNLVLYAGNRAWDDRTLTTAKLYLILWLSDCLAYAKTGHSITGAEYVHMPGGPGPADADRILHAMEQEGELLLRDESYFTRSIQRPLALREPHLDDLFEPSQIALVEEVMRQFEGQGLTEAAEWAHANSVGWRLTRSGERIPYETIFLSPNEPIIHEERDREGVTRQSA